MDSQVLNMLSGNSKYKLDNEKDLRSNHPSSYTATISGFNNVFNILPGTVLFLGFYKGLGTVYLAVSKHEMIRYMNLKTIEVWKGQQLSTSELVGTTYTAPLQFEYCTVYKDQSPYPIRFADRTYYKQNPIDILDGKYWPYKEIIHKSGIVRPGNSYLFDADQDAEWYSYKYKIQGFEIKK